MAVFRRHRGNDEGAAAVEFALVVPLLLLLAFGIITFGIIFSQQLTINAAVREGARRAIVNEVNSSRTCQGIVDTIKSKASGLAMAPSTIQVKVTQIKQDGTVAANANACGTTFVTTMSGSNATHIPCVGSYDTSSNTTGSLLVEVNYPSTLPAAFPPIPGSITLRSKAVFRCEFAA